MTIMIIINTNTAPPIVSPRNKGEVRKFFLGVTGGGGVGPGGGGVANIK